MREENHSKRSLWTDALRHLNIGLELLDESDAPGDIGAHIDLAICRLEKLVAALNGQPHPEVAPQSILN